MRAIIDGKIYDTETAMACGDYTHGFPRDFDYVDETLYRTKKGRFFTAGTGGPQTKYGRLKLDGGYGVGQAIIPIDRDEAMRWGEAHMGLDRFIEIFGEPEEA